MIAHQVCSWSRTFSFGDRGREVHINVDARERPDSGNLPDLSGSPTRKAMTRTSSGQLNVPVTPRFPEGIRVLVVDDDPVCLRIVHKVLQHCKFEVTTSTSGLDALARLKADPDYFHIVLSDVYMPDMDGFKLLEQVGIEMDIPVIMMSSNADTSVVFRGITAGAVDYLIKPVRVEELRNIWQHVVRRRHDMIGQPDSGAPNAEDSNQGNPSSTRGGDVMESTLAPAPKAAGAGDDGVVKQEKAASGRWARQPDSPKEGPRNSMQGQGVEDGAQSVGMETGIGAQSVGLDTGTGVQAMGMDTGMGTGMGRGVGVGMGVGTGLEGAMGVGIGNGMGSAVGTGMEMRQGMGITAGMGMGMGMGAGMGFEGYMQGPEFDSEVASARNASRPVRAAALRAAEATSMVVRATRSEERVSPPASAAGAKAQRKGLSIQEVDGASPGPRSSKGSEGVKRTGAKKHRVVWTVDMHQKFVDAVNQLGVDKAVPKRILQLMEVPGLTRENVASHLQKYRLYLKKMQSHSHSGSAVPKPKSNTVWGLKPSKEATAEWERPRVNIRNPGFHGVGPSSVGPPPMGLGTVPKGGGFMPGPWGSVPMPDRSGPLGPLPFGQMPPHMMHPDVRNSKTSRQETVVGQGASLRPRSPDLGMMHQHVPGALGHSHMGPLQQQHFGGPHDAAAGLRDVRESNAETGGFSAGGMNDVAMEDLHLIDAEKLLQDDDLMNLDGDRGVDDILNMILQGDQ